MKTFTVKYEARAEKAVEVIEYESLDEICDYLVMKYQEGNPIVIGETERYMIWVCDPTLQLHVSPISRNGEETC